MASANEASDYITGQVKQITQGNFTPPPGFAPCDNAALPTLSGNPIVLTDLCILTPDGVKIILTGTVNFSINAPDSVTIDTQNFKIETPNATFFLNLDIAASKDGVTLSMSLTDSLGVEISTASLEVVGGTYTGITEVNGSIEVANYGTVNVNMLESDPLTFACKGNNVPSGGTIEVTGADNSNASITFNNCESYTVTINGVMGDPISWPLL